MMAQNEQTTEEHKRRSSTHFVEVYTLHVFFATLYVVSRRRDAGLYVTETGTEIEVERLTRLHLD